MLFKHLNTPKSNNYIDFTAFSLFKVSAFAKMDEKQNGIVKLNEISQYF